MPKWRILIVDDEEDIRSIVRATLSTKYEVVEAGDGLDALEMLDLAEPDFVVLDVMMPLMDGHATCEAIRRHPRFKALSVLFLSALNTRDDMKKGYGAGANLYLTKPFDPSRLLRNVDLFFETNPPVYMRKRYTLEELKELRTKGADAIAMAHVERPVDPEPEAPASPSAAQPTAAPQAPRPQPAPASRPAMHTPTGGIPTQSGKARVLVVDDEQEILHMLRLALEKDFEPVVAHNGMEAIEKITSYQPDMIVLDAMMPKMSGFQLCQSLRRNVRFSKTPILFISARNTPRDIEYAKRMGGNDFLGKPFQPTQLIERLKNLQKLPEFKIYPKTLGMTQLLDMDSRRKKQLEEKKDRIHHKEETELEKFLREQTEA